MKIFCKSYLLCLRAVVFLGLVLIKQAQAATFEIKDMKEVKEKIDSLIKDGICQEEEILAVFDIDETLFTNNTKKINEIIQQHNSTLQNQNLSCQVSVDLTHPDSQFKLVYNQKTTEVLLGKFTVQTESLESIERLLYSQDNIVDLMDEMAKKVPVMALTARYGIQGPISQQQLEYLKFKFKNYPLNSKLPVLEDKDFQSVVLASAPVDHVDKFLKDNHISLTLKIHNDLVEPDDQGNMVLKDAKLQFRFTDQIKAYLLQNKNPVLYLLPPTKTYDKADVAVKGGHFNIQTFDFMPAVANVQDYNYYPMAYDKGVLSSSNADKGMVLKFLLESNPGNKFKCIVFADDSKARIDQMEQAFASSPDIKLFSFWYRKIELEQNQP